LNISKIYYALERIENKSVATMSSVEWYDLIRSDGKLTELERLPLPLSNAKLQGSLLTAVASGSAVPKPGLEVLRYDPVDAPFFINLDHYTVIENFHLHDFYPEVLKMTKLNDTPELQWELKNHIYVIKQPPNENHWLKDFPEYYLNALKKKDA